MDEKIPSINDYNNDDLTKAIYQKSKDCNIKLI